MEQVHGIKVKSNRHLHVKKPMKWGNPYDEKECNALGRCRADWYGNCSQNGLWYENHCRG